MPHVAIVGNASWGTALGIVLARKGVHVKLWTRTEEEAKKLDKDRENRTYLPGFSFPSRLKVTDSLDKALKKADGVVLAVPAQRMRQNARQLKEHLREDTLVISASKGIEVETGKRMSEVLKEELNGDIRPNICVLSGPNIAQEAANDMQSVAVVASRDLAVAQAAQRLLKFGCGGGRVGWRAQERDCVGCGDGGWPWLWRQCQVCLHYSGTRRGDFLWQGNEG
jgi:glycerol-3-phosphate dehydrogenase (NAD(P)+)